MIDESILKSNFIGRDGFRWWIGQIPPIEAQKTQANGGGWGNRTKVRILGYHPYSTAELSNDDLPWAQVLLSPTSGSGAANYAVNPKLRPGDTVLGFFLDGDSAQIPVIIGCFGRTDSVPSTTFQSPFVPFTGYTRRIPAPNGTLYKSEASEENSTAQKSPRDVKPEQIRSLNAKSSRKDEVFYFSGVGKKVVLGNSSNDTMSKGIGAEVNNILQRVNDVTNKIQNVKSEIGRSVAKIVGIATGFVADAANSVYTKLIPLLQQGLKALYNVVYSAVLAATQNPAVAHLAGVAAQTAMIPAVTALESYIPKIIGIVSNNLFKSVEGMLTDVVGNVKHFKSCVADQFVGSLLNDIVGKIERGLSGVLGGVGKILSAAFSVGGFLRSGISAIKSIGGLFDINQNKNKSVGSAEEWVIGIGVVNAVSDASKFANILKNMNIANGIGSLKNNAKDIKSGWDIFSGSTKNKNNQSFVGGCYTAEKINCSAPKVRVFGGYGDGVVAESIMGSFNTDSSGTTTGSVIGVKVKEKGKGYLYPPFVEIVDDCDQGYGVVARSVINDEGEVTEIYIVSEGENYPIDDTNINFVEEIATTNPSNISNYVSSVYIQQPGFGYEFNDSAFDDFGNTYSITIDDDGSIINVAINTPTTESGIVTTESGAISQIDTIIPNSVTTPVTTSSPRVVINNYIIVGDLPIITIESETGVGAILNPILDKLPIEVIQGNESSIKESKFVKDCIT